MTTPANELREQRLVELVEIAEAAQVRSDAYAALSALIRHADVPVGRWESIWLEVAKRLSRDATIAGYQAYHATERLPDVRVAMDARERVR